VSGLDNSQDVTDEQSLQEGHLKGHEGHFDPKAEKIGEQAAQHAREAKEAQQHK
jgi:hypothetical protein